MGPLQDPVTWHGINYAGTQTTQRDFQNKRKPGWTGTSSFVLEVPLCNLRTTIIYSVPSGHTIGPIVWKIRMTYCLGYDLNLLSASSVMASCHYESTESNNTGLKFASFIQKKLIATCSDSFSCASRGLHVFA